MRISKKLNDAINTQIGEELKASNGYANMAAYFNKQGLVPICSSINPRKNVNTP